MNLDGVKVQVRIPCQPCDGTGRSESRPCKICMGQKDLLKWVPVEVFINSLTERVLIAQKALEFRQGRDTLVRHG